MKYGWWSKEGRILPVRTYGGAFIDAPAESFDPFLRDRFGVLT